MELARTRVLSKLADHGGLSPNSSDHAVANAGSVPSPVAARIPFLATSLIAFQVPCHPIHLIEAVLWHQAGGVLREIDAYGLRSGLCTRIVVDATSSPLR
jgi:hypothetical protein